MGAARRSRTLQSTGRASEGPLAREIAALGPWFHNLHLPDGVQTAPDHPLGDFPRRKWEQLAPALPRDLSGSTVLDIGCNAGFYSFELARRGAQVLAIDGDEHYLRQARWAKQRFEFPERIELVKMQVYEVARLEDQFDIVLFMGVFYHLRYPVLAFDLVADRVRDQLVFQSLTMRDGAKTPLSRALGFDEMKIMNETAWPKIAFVEHELAGDPTNWWVPNLACLETLIRSAGFRVESRPGHELFVCRRSKSWRKARARFSEQLDAVLALSPVQPRREGEDVARNRSDDEG